MLDKYLSKKYLSPNFFLQPKKRVIISFLMPLTSSQVKFVF